MTVREFLPVVLFVGAILALVALAWPGEKPEKLVAVTEGPRPPVVADTKTRPQVLRGLGSRLLNLSGNALRRERNAIATQHTEAVALWQAGKKPLREVEELEQMLWTARHKVGEIKAQVLHEKLAELFGREEQRMTMLVEAGKADQRDLDLVRLYVARERHVAGLPSADAQKRDYETLRKAFLAEERRRGELLIESKIRTREVMELEWGALEKDFPELPTSTD